MKFILFALSLSISAVLFSGCNETKSEAKVIEVHKEEAPTLKHQNIVKDIFQSDTKISTNNKKIALVFGVNEDIYSTQLKEDIANSKLLQTRFKDEFSSYYIDANDNQKFQIPHDAKYVDVDTKTLIAIYGIKATPSIIFTDEKGKAVLLIPGYIPTQQLLATMDFMNGNSWIGKNRKNGEVYEALKEYYQQNDIDLNNN